MVTKKTNQDSEQRWVNLNRVNPNQYLRTLSISNNRKGIKSYFASLIYFEKSISKLES